MTDLSSYTVIELERAESRLVERYMCNKNYCPCSITIDPQTYGERASEFQLLDTTGTVTKFYEDCYPKIINSGLDTELSE
jgi:hypothetical protein